VSYHIYSITKSNREETRTRYYLVKKIGEKSDLTVLINSKDGYHSICYTVPDDATYLGMVSDVQDAFISLTSSNGAEVLPADAELVWIVRGLWKNLLKTIHVDGTSKVFFALPVPTGTYKDNETVKEAEWQAVLTMFPKATKENKVFYLSSRANRSSSKYGEDYDHALESKIQGKRR
jgi:hypothetical protein